VTTRHQGLLLLPPMSTKQQTHTCKQSVQWSSGNVENLVMHQS